MDKTEWPAWFYGPGKQAAIFERPEDVPAGWRDAPGKVNHLDHDGDGVSGGGRPGRKRKAKA